MSTAIIFSTLIATSLGLMIEVIDDNVKCQGSTIQIVCTSSTTEIGSNSLSIERDDGSTKVTVCQGMTCTAPSDPRYNVTFNGEKAMLTLRNVDFSRDSTKWSCVIGNTKADMKLKFLNAGSCETSSDPFLSLRGVTVIDVILLIIAVAVLVLLIVHLFCSDMCKRCTRPTCLACQMCDCSKKSQDEEKPTGYQGKRYEVKTSYVIEDPNHVPDASAKKITSRSHEAKEQCKNFDSEKKEKAKEYLEKFVEARKPSESTDPLLNSKK